MHIRSPNSLDWCLDWCLSRVDPEVLGTTEEANRRGAGAGGWCGEGKAPQSSSAV